MSCYRRRILSVQRERGLNKLNKPKLNSDGAVCRVSLTFEDLVSMNTPRFPRFALDSPSSIFPLTFLIVLRWENYHSPPPTMSAPQTPQPVPAGMDPSLARPPPARSADVNSILSNLHNLLAMDHSGRLTPLQQNQVGSPFHVSAHRHYLA